MPIVRIGHASGETAEEIAECVGDVASVGISDDYLARNDYMIRQSLMTVASECESLVTMAVQIMTMEDIYKQDAYMIRGVADSIRAAMGVSVHTYVFGTRPYTRAMLPPIMFPFAVDMCTVVGIPPAVRAIASTVFAQGGNMDTYMKVSAIMLSGYDVLRNGVMIMNVMPIMPAYNDYEGLMKAAGAWSTVMVAIIKACSKRDGRLSCVSLGSDPATIMMCMLTCLPNSYKSRLARYVYDSPSAVALRYGPQKASSGAGGMIVFPYDPLLLEKYDESFCPVLTRALMRAID
jgi:hypothetical protein